MHPEPSYRVPCGDDKTRRRGITVYPALSLRPPTPYQHKIEGQTAADTSRDCSVSGRRRSAGCHELPWEIREIVIVLETLEAKHGG